MAGKKKPSLVAAPPPTPELAALRAPLAVLYHVDKAWFVDHIIRIKSSYTQLAARFDTHKSAMSLILDGKQRMTPRIAVGLAEAFGVPVSEVLARAGVSAPMASDHPVPLIGWLSPEGVMRRESGMGVVEGPPGANRETWAAVRTQAPGSYNDGWIHFFQPSTGISMHAMGKLCIVTTENGAELLRVVQKGYEPGTFNIYSTGGGSAEKLRSAAPIAWIRA